MLSPRPWSTPTTSDRPSRSCPADQILASAGQEPDQWQWALLFATRIINASAYFLAG
jgi:hypothetical protein